VDPRVAHAIDRIEEQLHLPIRVAELAADAGLSVSQLTRLFRAATGQTPGAFLHARRMMRARVLVECTSLSIVEVMTRVGASDPSHFARDFRRTHGLSPRALRVQLRLATRRRAVVV
jgi:transcriptional regulator GlxA family with amidase domain